MSDLTPPLLRIEPDEEHRHQRIEPERQPVVAENQQLHDGADHVDTQRGTQHLRHEEEPCPGMVREDAEAPVEVFVERHHPEAVEGRDEQERDDQLPHGETGDHLHVGERIDGDRARHRDESHARDRSPDHGESRHIPWRAPVAGEKPGIVGTPSRKPGDDKKYGYIAQYGGDNGERCHKRSQRSDLSYKYSKKGCTAAIEGHFSTKKTTSGNGLRPPGAVPEKTAGVNGRTNGKATGKAARQRCRAAPAHPGNRHAAQE